LGEKIDGTNACRVFHLEELKMSGKIGAKIAVDGTGFVAGILGRQTRGDGPSAAKPQRGRKN
jgi:hypothetical protein